ncbi:fatty acid desaturase 2-like [Acanthaster planci]|uniref:Fatty acid desaturase 2-like n=1 Tax=Acanthaster planci TaxID=133434 RepID=A0A8B7ZIF8_ACAPL|nr:fatty acid desaturase 2-like [Acanthaster planci]
MGKGQQGQVMSPVGKDITYTWDEIKKHNGRYDKWLVIENGVYDVTHWMSKHPGGFKVLSHYGGEDATEAFVAFHPDKKLVRKYMKPLCIGTVEDKSPKSKLVTDMEALRVKAEAMGLFKANMWFYAAHLGHILAAEVLAWAVLWCFGVGWLPYLLATVLLTVEQAQSSWFLHDLGHLSVFRKSRWNHLLQYFVTGALKGASCHWWNYRHYQHHAKPNIIRKDPDIKMPYLFVLGDKQPVTWGSKKRKYVLPFNYQQIYFFFTLPPLLMTLYFHYEYFAHVIRKKLWKDLAWMSVFFVKHTLLFGLLLGGWGVFLNYMLIKFLESNWFVWTSQMNHIPMEIDHDQRKEWLPAQLHATCDVESSFFNDWFTGHLNFQIEHHLFPTMPRHNLHKIAPDVKALCEKHNICYQTKSLSQAFADIVRSLKHSGQLWYDAYHHT